MSSRDVVGLKTGARARRGGGARDGRSRGGRCRVLCDPEQERDRGVDQQRGNHRYIRVQVEVGGCGRALRCHEGDGERARQGASRHAVGHREHDLRRGGRRRHAQGLCGQPGLKPSHGPSDRDTIRVEEDEGEGRDGVGKGEGHRPRLARDEGELGGGEGGVQDRGGCKGKGCRGGQQRVHEAGGVLRLGDPQLLQRPLGSRRHGETIRRTRVHRSDRAEGGVVAGDPDVGVGAVQGPVLEPEQERVCRPQRERTPGQQGGGDLGEHVKGQGDQVGDEDGGRTRDAVEDVPEAHADRGRGAGGRDRDLRGGARGRKGLAHDGATARDRREVAGVHGLGERQGGVGRVALHKGVRKDGRDGRVGRNGDDEACGWSRGVGVGRVDDAQHHLHGPRGRGGCEDHRGGGLREPQGAGDRDTVDGAPDGRDAGDGLAEGHRERALCAVAGRGDCEGHDVGGARNYRHGRGRGRGPLGGLAEPRQGQRRRGARGQGHHGLVIAAEIRPCRDGCDSGAVDADAGRAGAEGFAEGQHRGLVGGAVYEGARVYVRDPRGASDGHLDGGGLEVVGVGRCEAEGPCVLRSDHDARLGGIVAPPRDHGQHGADVERRRRRRREGLREGHQHGLGYAVGEDIGRDAVESGHEHHRGAHLDGLDQGRSAPLHAPGDRKRELRGSGRGHRHLHVAELCSGHECGQRRASAVDEDRARRECVAEGEARGSSGWVYAIGRRGHHRHRRRYRGVSGDGDVDGCRVYYTRDGRRKAGDAYPRGRLRHCQREGYPRPVDDADASDHACGDGPRRVEDRHRGNGTEREVTVKRDGGRPSVDKGQYIDGVGEVPRPDGGHRTRPAVLHHGAVVQETTRTDQGVELEVHRVLRARGPREDEQASVGDRDRGCGYGREHRAGGRVLPHGDGRAGCELQGEPCLDVDVRYSYGPRSHIPAHEAWAGEEREVQGLRGTLVRAPEGVHDSGEAQRNSGRGGRAEGEGQVPEDGHAHRARDADARHRAGGHGLGEPHGHLAVVVVHGCGHEGCAVGAHQRQGCGVGEQERKVHAEDARLRRSPLGDDRELQDIRSHVRAVRVDAQLVTGDCVGGEQAMACSGVGRAHGAPGPE